MKIVFLDVKTIGEDIDPVSYTHLDVYKRQSVNSRSTPYFLFPVVESLSTPAEAVFTSVPVSTMESVSFSSPIDLFSVYPEAVRE